MILNIDYNLKDLAGNEIEDANMGKVVGNLLYIKSGDIDPIKAISWAKKMWNGEDLDLDKGDLEKLKSWIHGDERPTSAVKAELESKIIEVLNQKEG